MRQKLYLFIFAAQALIVAKPVWRHTPLIFHCSYRLVSIPPCSFHIYPLKPYGSSLTLQTDHSKSHSILAIQSPWYPSAGSAQHWKDHSSFSWHPRSALKLCLVSFLRTIWRRSFTIISRAGARHFLCGHDYPELWKGEKVLVFMHYH